MKKKAVFTLVACSIAAVFLICVLAVGLSSGVFGAPRDEGAAGGRQTDGPSGERYEYTWDVAESPVTGLDVEWVSGTVELKVTEGSSLRVVEQAASGKLDENKRLTLTYGGGTLKIKWRKEFITFSLFEDQSKDLTVEVPREVAESLKELDCSNTSGLIIASGFTAGEMDFSTTSGDMELFDLTGEEADISTTSGAVTLQNVSLSGELSAETTSGPLECDGVRAGEVDVDTVSGSVFYGGAADQLEVSSVSAGVRAEMEGCPLETKMSSVSGDLTLAIPDGSEFRAGYSSVSGGFSSDFPVTGSSGRSGQAVCGKGGAVFEFTTTSGNMKVEMR